MVVKKEAVTLVGALLFFILIFKIEDALLSYVILFVPIVLLVSRVFIDYQALGRKDRIVLVILYSVIRVYILSYCVNYFGIIFRGMEIPQMAILIGLFPVSMLEGYIILFFDYGLSSVFKLFSFIAYSWMQFVMISFFYLFFYGLSFLVALAFATKGATMLS